MIARLYEQLNVDPFRQAVIEMPMTISDLIGTYENAFA